MSKVDEIMAELFDGLLSKQLNAIEVRSVLTAALAQQGQVWMPIDSAPHSVMFLAVLECGGDKTICTMRRSVADRLARLMATEAAWPFPENAAP